MKGMSYKDISSERYMDDCTELKFNLKWSVISEI